MFKITLLFPSTSFHLLLRLLFPATDQILNLALQKTGGKDRSAARGMLSQQKPKGLKNYKDAQKDMRAQKSAQEKAKLEKAKAIGLCPMGFDVRF